MHAYKMTCTIAVREQTSKAVVEVIFNFESRLSVLSIYRD